MHAPLKDAAPPTHLLGVIGTVDIIAVSVDPEAKPFPLVIALCLGNRHYLYPVLLGENTLSGETGAVGLHQLTGGIINGCVWKSSHWEDLEKNTIIYNYTYVGNINNAIFKKNVLFNPYGHLSNQNTF